MKPESRVLGFDDGPFTWEDEVVPVVGVVMRGGHDVEAVLKREVRVDGDEATTVLADAVTQSRYRSDLRVILLDGAAVGGFNVIDLDALHETTEIPVLALTRGEPDADGVQTALRKHFRDAERRWGILSRQWPERFETAGEALYVASRGLDRQEAAAVLARTTVRGLIPEPLRLAHLVATAIVRGESRGG